MKIELRKKLSNDGWIPLNENTKIKVDYPTMAQQSHLENLLYEQKMLEFYRYLIKYTIKDWKGVDEDCRIVDNELADDLWEKVCYNVNQITELGVLINSEIEFLDIDIKK